MFFQHQEDHQNDQNLHDQESNLITGRAAGHESPKATENQLREISECKRES